MRSGRVKVEEVEREKDVDLRYIYFSSFFIPEIEFWVVDWGQKLHTLVGCRYITWVRFIQAGVGYRIGKV